MVTLPANYWCKGFLNNNQVYSRNGYYGAIKVVLNSAKKEIPFKWVHNEELRLETMD